MMTRSRPAIVRAGAASAPAGFTLVEAVISTLIVGMMLVAALTMVGGSARARQIHANRGLGAELAHDLMSEVLGTRYEEPDDTPLFGRESPESASLRSDWDDVDDYDGWSGSPPEDKDGTARTNTAGWQRDVTVTYANPTTLQPTGTSIDTGLKRIVVTVTAPNGEQTVAAALRSRFGMFEQ